jgi:Transposase and inactivated derivatives
VTDLIDQTISDLAPLVGVKAACEAVGRPRATHYRQHRKSPPPPKPPRQPRRRQPRALSGEERAEVLSVLRSEDHVDEAPATVYAKLLDDGVYLCSVPTMYRVLRGENEVRERRRLARHPAAKKPELVALGPNQVWSWDITKLLGPVKWTYYYLYVIIDIFSRFVVGWMLARAERAYLAERLLAETIIKQHITRDTLVIHADRGTSMASRPVAFLLADLGVTKSHSRPHCSNDNPYSESNFKTLKYRPDFPDRFGSFEDAHAFCGRFFAWYNEAHRHSGIAFHTPADMHYGRAEVIHEQRNRVLAAAYLLHPERFVRKLPEPPALPTAAWINQPAGDPPSSQSPLFLHCEEPLHDDARPVPGQLDDLTADAEGVLGEPRSPKHQPGNERERRRAPRVVQPELALARQPVASGAELPAELKETPINLSQKG